MEKKKGNYLRQIEQIILDHRDDCKLTCPETCWCWDIETIIYQHLCRDYNECKLKESKSSCQGERCAFYSAI